MNYPALLIDTSTRYLVFARLDGEGQGKIITRENPGQNEEAIDSAVAGFFGDLSGLKEIWLGQGPGSFVGLRSSFAYVRMLAMLMNIPCRLFYSSLLWRNFFAVSERDWFLTRTNAKLFYADRFLDGREALPVEAGAIAGLTGEKYCFFESWVSTNEKAGELVTNPPFGVSQTNGGLAGNALPANICRFENADFRAGVLSPVHLKLTTAQNTDALTPLYGHELNFVQVTKTNG